MVSWKVVSIFYTDIITVIIIIIISTAPQNHCQFFLLLISSPNRIQLTNFPVFLSFPLNQEETTEAKYAKYRRLSKVSYDWSPPTIANTIFQDTALTNFLGILKSEYLSCLHICLLSDWYKIHTSYLPGAQGRCPCKFFLLGVNFSRLNTKHWPFYYV